MPNRLSHATSPYLRQHENNPVDWYPWGDEAFARARDEGKPILLSIGYSACHWCHVMAHESFEDPATAALQNELYVNIKVDREEHPDVDQIYQLALQLTGENGGWPLTMWLLPDGRPFFGGTYFPPDDRHGRASFTRVLRALADAYRDQRPKVEEAANELRRGLRNLAELPTVAPGRTVPKDGVDRAAFQLAQRIDRERGGFAGAPKFPNVTSKLLLLRAADRARRRGDAPRAAGDHGEAVLRTLDHMIAGGIYDQLGGGFHRYSTDEDWLVPHFEKMLYDQGLLLRLLAEAYAWRTTPRYAAVIRQTAAYLERDMRSPEGGLYTAEDADSEGIEGKYYVWTPSEVAAICGAEGAALIARIYDVREGGNWSDPHGHGPVGASILHRIAEPANDDEAAELAAAEAKLLAVRQARVRPLCDDKILASSNGLALAGLAEAARVLGDASLLASARRTAEFLLTHMRDEHGRMYRVKQTGSAARLPGTLDDHAFVADGMIALYEASGEGRWLQAAFALTKLSLALFYDEKRATMFLTAASDEALVVRPLSFHDSAIPSGLAVTVQNLLRLGAASGDRALLTAADRLIDSHADRALTQPFGLSQFVSAIDLQQRGCSEIVLAGDDTTALERAVASVYLPNRLIARVTDAPPELASLCEGKTAASSGAPLAYVCRNFACERPEGDASQLVVRLEQLGA